MSVRAVVSLLVLFLFVYSQRNLIKQQPLKQFFLPAYALKIVAGIGLGLLYSHYYGYGDTFAYHNDACILTDLFTKDASKYFAALFSIQLDDEVAQSLVFAEEPRALFMVKLLSVVQLLVGTNYWVMTVFVASFSFFGMWYLANQLTRNIEDAKWPAAIAFLFYPSVVFWSSGLLKESFALGAIGFGVGTLVPSLLVNRKVKPMDWLIAIAAFCLLFKLKYFYALLLIPLLVACLLIRFFDGKKGWAKLAIWSGLLLLLVGAASLLHPNLSGERFTMVIVDNYYTMIGKSSIGKHLVFANIEDDLMSISSHFPRAVLAGIYAPLFSTSNLLVIFASIENIALVLLTVLSLKRIPSILGSRYSHLIMAVLVYAVVEAGFLALSTPVYGTLVRYKIGFLPFLVFLILLKNPVLGFLGVHPKIRFK